MIRETSDSDDDVRYVIVLTADDYENRESICKRIVQWGNELRDARVQDERSEFWDEVPDVDFDELSWDPSEFTDGTDVNIDDDTDSDTQ